jgi:Histidine phosphatase superfamily (branch 2)
MIESVFDQDSHVPPVECSSLTCRWSYQSKCVYRCLFFIQTSYQSLINLKLNNTLVTHMCPNAGNSEIQKNQWQAVYAPPITARLNAAAPGANLTDTDISSLISLCPFETVAKGAHSPFCSLFTLDDFRAHEYLGDLDKYYHTG